MVPVSCPPWPGSRTIRRIFSPRTLVSVRSPLLVRSAALGVSTEALFTSEAFVAGGDATLSRAIGIVLTVVDSAETVAPGPESTGEEAAWLVGSLDLDGV